MKSFNYFKSEMLYASTPCTSISQHKKQCAVRKLFIQ
jgi:predicted phosphodiesterase